MNFQQLRIMRETVRQSFNLTEVANALFTSQSGVSKHIKDLEDELGIELFVRKGKRLLGLTEPGKELVGIVERMLMDAQNIKRLAEQFSAKDEGQLTVVTTHTQARYTLPQVVAQFKKAFPKVHLVLHQGSPAEIVSMLLGGEADIGIATEAIEQVPELASFPYYSWHHAAVVLKDHPLTQLKTLTLEAIADHPIITYHQGYTGRASIDSTFTQAGLEPDIVMSALDADVIKTYVELGLGVGLVASMAFNPDRDQDLTLLDTGHLFEPKVTRIAVRRGHYLRGYAYRFIEYCQPSLDEAAVRLAVSPVEP
jgi:LysR family cys regulon transcriptional activator